jgi:hypothetical protein
MITTVYHGSTERITSREARREHERLGAHIISTNKLFKVDPECGERRSGLTENRDFNYTNKRNWSIAVYSSPIRDR